MTSTNKAWRGKYDNSGAIEGSELNMYWRFLWYRLD